MSMRVCVERFDLRENVTSIESGTMVSHGQAFTVLPHAQSQRQQRFSYIGRRASFGPLNIFFDVSFGGAQWYSPGSSVSPPFPAARLGNPPGRVGPQLEFFLQPVTLLGFRPWTLDSFTTASHSSSDRPVLSLQSRDTHFLRHQHARMDAVGGFRLSHKLSQKYNPEKCAEIVRWYAYNL